MNTPHLARIAYASALRDPPSRAALDALLSTWRRRNAERCITGLLLDHAGSVFQVIEGFPEDVVRLYEAILRDRRHHSIVTLVHDAACRRCFGDWSMGHGRLTLSELSTIPELRALADPGFRFTQCNPAMGEALIAAFTTGHWRRSIV